MQKPILLTVDDEPQVLNAIERDLRAHFKGEVRVMKANGGQEALETVRQLKTREMPLALLLVDQRMPGMSGTELLRAAMEIFPDAKKVLLTAYADTQAAITSINEIGLDHYLMKPWDPPEEHLFPVLDDLLEQWASEAPVPEEGLRVVGTRWSGSSHDVKDFLARNRVPYRWIDLERDESYKALVEPTGKLPLLIFPDGEKLFGPDRTTLATKLGMRTAAKMAFYDLAVIGAGSAGLAAAVYGASEGLRTVLVEKEATGGQAGTSSRIENYLGFPKGLSGTDLARRATAQAERLGAEILVPQEVASLRVDGNYKILCLADGTELTCMALVAATGVAVRRLEVPGAEPLVGAGVFYGAALTEAAHYRGEDVLVVGGANSAGQGAMFFSRYARKVTMVVRGPDLRASMSTYLIDQIASTPNIEVRTETAICELRAEAGPGGEPRLGSVVVERRGEQVELAAAALFVFIGAAPHTQLLEGIVARDEKGFVLTGPDLGPKPKGWRLEREPYLFETSVPGIFAAGDVRAGSSKRVAAAVGEGAVAVRFVHQYLGTV
jgi:thioredoxin reductase (NADPH)